MRVDSGTEYKNGMGDKVVLSYYGDSYSDAQFTDGTWTYRQDGTWAGSEPGTVHPKDLIGLWGGDSVPVRIVTIKEIVTGVFGRLEVHAHLVSPHQVIINLTDRDGEKIDRGNFDASELRSIVASMNALIEVMEQ